MTMVTEQGLRLDAIESVRIGMPSHALKVVDGRDMHNICVQDMLTAALVRGGLKWRDSPFPDVLADPVFVRLHPRVTVHADADLDRDQPEGRGAVVTIARTDGTSVSRRVDHPNGHSRRGGLSWRDLEGKWREGLPGADVGRMIALEQRLDEIEDARELLAAFERRADGVSR